MLIDAPLIPLAQTRLASPTVELTAPAPAAPAPAAEPSEQTQPRPAPALPRPLKGVRDQRLDFWRGLCLIDMLLVHLIHQGLSLTYHLDTWVGEYTRFAAGGFVFIAGLSIARIFLPRAMDDERRWGTYVALFKRSGVILLTHYVAEIGFLVMWPMFGGITFQQPLHRVLDILLLRTGYDLLPFYVVMVALAPLMLELLRRNLQWVLAAASIGIFAVSHATGWWYTYAFPIQRDFIPSLWQLMFVAGLLGAGALGWYDRRRTASKVGIAAAVLAVHVILFIAYYGPDFGLSLYLPLAFTKVPLSTGEALRYLTLIAAIAIVTDLLWKRFLEGGRLAAAAECLGRHSLPVYVVHVWLVQVTVRSAELVPLLGGRIALCLLALVAMWAFAWALDRSGKAKRARKKAGEPSASPSIAWYQRPVPTLAAIAATSLVVLMAVNAQQIRTGGIMFETGYPARSPAGDLLMDRDEGFLPDMEPYDEDWYEIEPEAPDFPSV